MDDVACFGILLNWLMVGVVGKANETFWELYGDVVVWLLDKEVM